MREIYYYGRNRKKQPILTICLIINETGQAISKGLAICSKLDMPCKKVGRAIAKTRAAWAFENKTNNCKIGRQDLLDRGNIHGDYKAVYRPPLAVAEYMLIDKILGRKTKTMAQEQVAA